VKFAKMLRDQSGASALEFGLTAPVFFLFIFGVIEVGLLFWTQIGLQHGAENASYSFQFPGIIPLDPLTLTAQACFPT
jgi:Flp pilus assembly protein TadG